ncbi:protein kinase [Candidatus Gracilibacteria bacterium]|nr:protein kinase [Candidatus Gracilibacteria bacterium]
MIDEIPFGQLVRAWRRGQDLTQEELARRVGCAAITVRKIEAGAMRPRSRWLRAWQRSGMCRKTNSRVLCVRRVGCAREPRSASLCRQHLRSSAPADVPTMRGAVAISLPSRSVSAASASFTAQCSCASIASSRSRSCARSTPISRLYPSLRGRGSSGGALEHPHIVPLYDFWREPGVAYLVMRYVRGGSLQSLLDQGRRPSRSRYASPSSSGAALHTAHRAGVVHRDLKPANVLLDEDAHAYLADFGIAKDLANPDATLSLAGAFVGSPAYSSPEQIRAEAVTPQTDVYALGVLLYELLTGKRPFYGPSPIDFIQQHLNAPMPALAAARADLPAALDTVVQRATAKRSAERYTDISALLDDLRKAFHPPALPTVLHAAPQLTATPTVVLDLVAADNPYKGLQPFDEADAATFFGREALVQRLLARLGESGDLTRFLAIIGPSGSGKSSVVRAGLLPALRRGTLPGSEHWYIVDLLPGADPIAELAAALRRIAPAAVEAVDLHALLRAGGHSLLQAANLVLPDTAGAELVLFIDQFEELFTLAPTRRCDGRSSKALSSQPWRKHRGYAFSLRCAPILSIDRCNTWISASFSASVASRCCRCRQTRSSVRSSARHVGLALPWKTGSAPRSSPRSVPNPVRYRCCSTPGASCTPCVRAVCSPTPPTPRSVVSLERGPNAPRRCLMSLLRPGKRQHAACCWRSSAPARPMKIPDAACAKPICAPPGRLCSSSSSLTASGAPGCGPSIATR